MPPATRFCDQCPENLGVLADGRFSVRCDVEIEAMQDIQPGAPGRTVDEHGRGGRYPSDALQQGPSADRILEQEVLGYRHGIGGTPPCPRPGQPQNCPFAQSVTPPSPVNRKTA